MSGNIRVFCRVKPLGASEKLRPPVASDTRNVIIKLSETKRKTYNFDRVFQPDSSQGMTQFLILVTHTWTFSWLVFKICRWCFLRDWTSNQIGYRWLQRLYFRVWTNRYWENLYNGKKNQSKQALWFHCYTYFLSCYINIDEYFLQEGLPNSPGIVPRAIKGLFKQVEESNHKFLIHFSMLEIYMGNLKDLLLSQATKPISPIPPR